MIDQSSLETARKLLRDRGLRATKPRVLVYGLLRELGGHHSVDALVAHLESRGLPVPRMSVYNVVTDLQHSGLIMCADCGPGRALYEASDEWHHHFVCRICLEVTDVPCILGRKPCLVPPGSAPGIVDEAQVIFRGICYNCQAKPQS